MSLSLHAMLTWFVINAIVGRRIDSFATFAVLSNASLSVVDVGAPNAWLALQIVLFLILVPRSLV
jgi:hypothetical protein